MLHPYVSNPVSELSKCSMRGADTFSTAWESIKDLLHHPSPAIRMAAGAWYALFPYEFGAGILIPNYCAAEYPFRSHYQLTK